MRNTDLFLIEKEIQNQGITVLRSRKGFLISTPTHLKVIWTPKLALWWFLSFLSGIAVVLQIFMNNGISSSESEAVWVALASQSLVNILKRKEKKGNKEIVMFGAGGFRDWPPV